MNKTIEFEAMVTDRAKWLAKDMNLVEEVTLRGRGVYAIEPGANVILAPVEPELAPSVDDVLRDALDIISRIDAWANTPIGLGEEPGIMLAGADSIIRDIRRLLAQPEPELEFDPCPFCGGEAAFGGKSVNPWAQHVAECANCHVAMGRNRKSDAVRDWNRRA